MSIPIAVAAPGEQPGTFRKMVLVDTEQQPAARTSWKTPERETEPATADAPGAPKRPRRIGTPPGEQHLAAPAAMVPQATSTPHRHPIHDLAVTTITPPAHPPAGQRGDDGGEWTKMVDDAREPTMVASAEQDKGPDPKPESQEQAASRAERCVAPDIPKKHRYRYHLLMNYLRSFEASKRAPPISPSEFGELMTDKAIRGTSYVDVLRALFVNSRYTIAGLCEAVAA